MAGTPETRYARIGDVHVAYQALADRGADLLFVPTATFPIDLLWDEPTVAGGLTRLASFSHLLTCDLIGVGSSDSVPISERPAMQLWADGLGAVLDAVDSEQASIFAMSESCLPAMLYAASHPERVHSLVLWSPFARYLRADDQPFGMPEDALVRYISGFEETVGTGVVVEVLAPSWAADAARRAWWARGERLSGGPGYFAQVLDLFLRTDFRSALDSVRVPVLALHRRGDRHVRGGHARAHWWSGCPMPGSSSSRATTTCGSRATSTPPSTRCSRSSPARVGPRRRTVCCRRCCSPTSTVRPSEHPSSATTRGRPCSRPTTGS